MFNWKTLVAQLLIQLQPVIEQIVRDALADILDQLRDRHYALRNDDGARQAEKDAINITLKKIFKGD